MPPVFAVPPPACWLALLPEQSLATQIGALPLTGALAAAAGLTSAEPTWPVPIDWSVLWPPVWL